jgi:hypothetical protein
MTILAIDPGNQQSAYCLIDADTRRPLEFAKVPNDHLRLRLGNLGPLEWDRAVVEMVASYGMAVGADVFETCVWIGRFVEVILTTSGGNEPQLIKRNPVKLHHCGTGKAKDGNIAQALRDRFGDKGTKANPGWFYGFSGDVWQAYALAVYVADQEAL